MKKLPRIIVYIGDNLTQKGEQLSDHLHPQKQIQLLQLLLGQGYTVFKTNSNIILSYLTCTLKATQVLKEPDDLYPIGLQDVAVIECDLDGKQCMLPDYKGLIDDDNILNNAIEEQNSNFDKLLQYARDNK